MMKNHKEDVMKTNQKSYKALLAVAGISLFAANGHAFTSLSKSNPIVAQATLTGAGSVTMAVAVKKVSDNQDVTSGAIDWTGVTLPLRWKVADNYIALTSNITDGSGGIQTYTDNTAADASPKFTGDKAVLTPAGLVDTGDTTKKLPTAWSIRHSTGAIPAVDPNGGVAAPGSALWLFHEDRAQVAIPTSHATAFTDGDAFVTVASANGIHFAQAPDQFGPVATNPVLPDNVSDIYLEADFGSAVTSAAGRTYRTSKLFLETFSQ
jgi:hypothetical protein